MANLEDYKKAFDTILNKSQTWPVTISPARFRGKGNESQYEVTQGIGKGRIRDLVAKGTKEEIITKLAALQK